MRHFIVLPLILLITFAADAAPPRAQGGWNGNNAYILATTDNDRVYTCDYTLVVTYSDGKTHTQSGQTQPTTGGTNLRAVEVSGSKQVVGAAVTKWQCS